MELGGARVLVAGASGALGGRLADRLLAEGARVVAAGRDGHRLAPVAQRCGTDPLVFDAVDTDSCGSVVTAAVEQLGGLDGLVVTVGVAGFGRAAEADDAVVEELFAVNVLGPMALVRAAAPHLEGGFVAVLSAILADLPTAGMAEYSAAKSALSTWLEVLRREERRRFSVLDVPSPSPRHRAGRAGPGGRAAQAAGAVPLGRRGRGRRACPRRGQEGGRLRRPGR